MITGSIITEPMVTESMIPHQKTLTEIQNEEYEIALQKQAFCNSIYEQTISF